MENKVFRKVSLDRLSSPEQLDQVMQVTNPRGWIGLAGVGVLLVMAIVWGFLGSLPEKVGGRGILLKSGGVFEVVTPAGGRVTDVSVSVGDSVNEGQVVAWVAQPDLSSKLEEARIRFRTLKAEYQQQLSFTTDNAQLESRSLAQQRESLRQSITVTEGTLQSLAERIRSQEQLVEQGLLTRQTLLQTRQQYDAAREKVRSSKSELAQLDVQQLSGANGRREAVAAAAKQVELAGNEVQQMERELKTASQILSPYTGRILEVMTEPGKMVGPGEAVLSLDLTGGNVRNLVAVIYVPSIHGKKVKPGMKIQIAPSTVRQEEFGMMVGRVTFVSNFPATSRGMARALKNDQLVQELSGGSAPYEVHAELIVDPTTQSQYRWTSSGGPPITIQSGTTALGNVTVDAERPIARVIPLFRRWSGI